jgi:hypothetical protein
MKKNGFFHGLTAVTVKINGKGVNLTRNGNVNVTKVAKDGENALKISVTPRSENNIRACGYTIGTNGTRKISALSPLSSTEKKTATGNLKTLIFALAVTLVMKQGKAEKITNEFPENAIRVVTWNKKTGVITTYIFSLRVTQNREVFVEVHHVESPCYRDANNTLFCPRLNDYLPELVKFVGDNLVQPNEIANLKLINNEYISSTDEIETIARFIPNNTGVVLRTFDPAFGYAEILTNRGCAIADIRQIKNNPVPTGNLTPTPKSGDVISFKTLRKANLINTDFFPENWFTRLPKMEASGISFIEKTPVTVKM